MQFLRLASEKNTSNGALVNTKNVFFVQTGPLKKEVIEDFIFGLIEHLNDIGIDISYIFHVNTVTNAEGQLFGHSYIYIEDIKLSCVLRGLTPEGVQLLHRENENPRPLREPLHCISVFRKGKTGDCVNYVIMRNVADDVEFHEAENIYDDRIVIINGLGSQKKDTCYIDCDKGVRFTQLKSSVEGTRHILIGHEIKDEKLLEVISSEYMEKYEEEMIMMSPVVFSEEKIQIIVEDEFLLLGSIGKFKKSKYLDYPPIDYVDSDGELQSYLPTFNLSNIKNKKNDDSIKNFEIKTSYRTPVPPECRSGPGRDVFITAYKEATAFMCRDGEIPSIYIKKNGEMIVTFDHRYCTCEIVMTLLRVIELTYKLGDVEKKYTLAFSHVPAYGNEEGGERSSQISSSSTNSYPTHSTYSDNRGRGNRGRGSSSSRGRGRGGYRGGYDDYQEETYDREQRAPVRGKRAKKAEYVDDEGFVSRR